MSNGGVIRVSLEVASLRSEAGGSSSSEVRLHNDGPEDATVELAVAGEARLYSWIAPDRVDVPAGGEATTKVGFHIPRASKPAAGPVAFKVTARSSGAGAPEASVSGEVVVLPYSVLSANLSPPVEEGDETLARVLTLTNRGNAPTTVTLSASADDDLEAVIRPSTLTVDLHTAMTADLTVRPRGPAQRPGGGSAAYRVRAEPDTGDAVELADRFAFAAAPARRAASRNVLIAVAAVVAAVIAVVVLAGGGGDDPDSGAPADAEVEQVAVEAPVANECPAEDHTDPHGITGLTPEDIPTLPASYSFFAVADDGCTPIRFNPCEPIHFVINPTNAPPEGVDDVREAFARLGRATGMEFVDEGLTDEEARRRDAYIPDRYPGRWAPILVTWSEFGEREASGLSQVVGRGAGIREGDQYVSGVLRLNKDAVINEETGTPVPSGFGPEIGSGTGNVGAEGVRWGRIILHELGHIVGLGHVRDTNQIMYPDTASQTFRPSSFRPGDREGLALLGREAGCLQTPPVPAG